ncbi:MAG: ABC transporter ATP-binding protein [Byssovorax sp.]
MSAEAPRAPLLLLDRVQARDASGPGGRARGLITAMSAQLGAGAHAFLGAPEDGTIALHEVLSGARSPSRGAARVVGVDPARTPSIRARIGALGPEPRLPPAPTVGDAVRLVLQARGEQGHRIDAVLDPFGLGALHARPLRSLSFAEARAVELSLALTTPAPLLIVLHEPFADLALPEPARAEAALADLARAGACVVVTTASPADARRLAARVFVLHQGLVVREATGDDNRFTLGDARLRAFVAPGPDGVRALAARLSAHPEIRALSWEDAPAAAPGLAVLDLRGESVEACSGALIDAAIEAGAAIEAFAPAAPDLGEVRAATDTLVRMRWAALRSSAARPAPAAPPAPPPVAPAAPAPPAADPAPPAAPSAEASESGEAQP